MEIVPPEGWPIAQRGLFMGYVGSVCFVWLSDLGADGEVVHGRELARAIDTRSPGSRVGVVYDVPRSNRISALARRDLARLLDDRREVLRRSTAAYALATPSGMVRGMLQAVFWLAPPPYPYTMVEHIRDAVAFVARHLPDVDAQGTLADYHRLLAEHAATIGLTPELRSPAG